ncbi:hypothetical protein BDW22DRAFT_1341144 [Trametopsis cervina]|nr:hypothetical protein BDW22DRAFT_1341144 [Trametopsis cervina]
MNVGKLNPVLAHAIQPFELHGRPDKWPNTPAVSWRIEVRHDRIKPGMCIMCPTYASLHRRVLLQLRVHAPSRPFRQPTTLPQVEQACIEGFPKRELTPTEVRGMENICLDWAVTAWLESQRNMRSYVPESAIWPYYCLNGTIPFSAQSHDNAPQTTRSVRTSALFLPHCLPESPSLCKWDKERRTPQIAEKLDATEAIVKRSGRDDDGREGYEGAYCEKEAEVSGVDGQRA